MGERTKGPTIPSTTTKQPPSAYPSAAFATTAITTSFCLRDSGRWGGIVPFLMKCQKSSECRCTAGPTDATIRLRAAVLFPAPGEPVRIRMCPAKSNMLFVSLIRVHSTSSTRRDSCRSVAALHQEEAICQLTINSQYTHDSFGIYHGRQHAVEQAWEMVDREF